MRLGRDGLVTVETDMTDIGTGTYTIIAQTAAEMMGVPLEHVVVKLGDSTFPASAGSGGQWGAANSTAGVYAACVKLREAVAQRLGFNSADECSPTARCAAANRSVGLKDAACVRRAERRGQNRVRRPGEDATSSRPSARISSRSGWMPSPA